jgi:hypothetical protein
MVGVAIIVLWSAGVRAADEGTWEGFRGIKWGTEITDAPGITGKKAETKSCFRKDDKLTIGEAKLKYILYQFYKGRFYSVDIRAEESTNWIALRDAVFAKYGEGKKLYTLLEQWYWGAPEFPGVKDVTMFLRHDLEGKTTLIMTYKPIADERRAEDAKKAKEAGKDF